MTELCGHFADSDIHKVQFTVGGQPLTNSRNQGKLGEMTSDTFAQYTGKDKKLSL